MIENETVLSFPTCRPPYWIPSFRMHPTISPVDPSNSCTQKMEIIAVEISLLSCLTADIYTYIRFGGRHLGFITSVASEKIPNSSIELLGVRKLRGSGLNFVANRCETEKNVVAIFTTSPRISKGC